MTLSYIWIYGEHSICYFLFFISTFANKQWPMIGTSFYFNGLITISVYLNESFYFWFCLNIFCYQLYAKLLASKHTWCIFFINVSSYKNKLLSNYKFDCSKSIFLILKEIANRKRLLKLYPLQIKLANAVISKNKNTIIFEMKAIAGNIKLSTKSIDKSIWFCVDAQTTASISWSFCQ